MNKQSINNMMIFQNEYFALMHAVQSLSAEDLDTVLNILMSTGYSFMDLNSFIRSSDYADLLRKTFNMQDYIKSKSEKYIEYRKTTSQKISKSTTMSIEVRKEQLIQKHGELLEDAYKNYIENKKVNDKNTIDDVIFFLNNNIPLEYDDQVLTGDDIKFAKDNGITEDMMKKFKQLKAIYGD